MRSPASLAISVARSRRCSRSPMCAAAQSKRTHNCRLPVRRGNSPNVFPTPRRSEWLGMTVALALSDAERYDEAIDIFDEAIRKRPLDARAVGNFASAPLDAAQYERSIAQSRLALDIRSRLQTFALRNIGHALLALGRAGEAEKAYQLAIRAEARGRGLPRVHPERKEAARQAAESASRCGDARIARESSGNPGTRLEGCRAAAGAPMTARTTRALSRRRFGSFRL